MEKFDKNQLLTAIRHDIIGELDAIDQYQSHIDRTDNQMAIKVWTDIRNEEQVHVGELLTLLAMLDPQMAQGIEKGEAEVREMLEKMDLGNI